jgi:hypothetical protein
LSVPAIVLLIILAAGILWIFAPIVFSNVSLDGECQVLVTVNGRQMTAAMENNASSQAFRRMLEHGPKTVNMRDYGAMEKLACCGGVYPRQIKTLSRSLAT